MSRGLGDAKTTITINRQDKRCQEAWGTQKPQLQSTDQDPDQPQHATLDTPSCRQRLSQSRDTIRCALSGHRNPKFKNGIIKQFSSYSHLRSTERFPFRMIIIVITIIPIVVVVVVIIIKMMYNLKMTRFKSHVIMSISHDHVLLVFCNEFHCFTCVVVVSRPGPGSS